MIRVQERPCIKVPGLTSLFVSFDFNKLIVDELKLLDNVYYNSDTKEWEIPLTHLTEFIDRTCVLDEIVLEVLSDVNTIEFPINLSSYKTNLFSHQEDGIKYGLTHDSWLLLDSPGLGKSLQLIYLAQELKNRNGIEHCLIICGINTLKTNWKNEIEKHSDLKCRILGQRINSKGRLVIDGIPERLKQLNEPIEEFFVITNIETLRDDKIVKSILKNKYNKFDMLVVDEIHACKSPTSIQGKHLLKLNKAKFRIGATGTLLLNNPLDTYVPLKWIGAEHSTYTNFRYYYCTYGGPFGNMLVGFKNLPVLKDQLEKYSLRRTKDILNLPEKNIITEYVDMSDSQSIFYNNIKDGIVQQVDKVKLHANNILAMASRLRQATAFPSILTTENVSSAKLDRAEDLATQIVSSGEKVVIFSTFKDPVYELAKRLQPLGVVIVTGDQKDFEIEAAKDKFQNSDSAKIFIGTWQKCGTGITLTAASYMIFIDTPWTAAQLLQCEDRIHRIGSNQPVFIYHLITKGTIDERVNEIVTDKGALADYIIDNDITEQGLNSLRKYIEELI